MGDPLNNAGFVASEVSLQICSPYHGSPGVSRSVHQRPKGAAPAKNNFECGSRGYGAPLANKPMKLHAACGAHSLTAAILMNRYGTPHTF